MRAMRLLGVLVLAVLLGPTAVAGAAPPWAPPRTVGEGPALEGASVLLTDRGRAVLWQQARGRRTRLLAAVLPGDPYRPSWRLVSRRTGPVAAADGAVLATVRQPRRDVLDAMAGIAPAPGLPFRERRLGVRVKGTMLLAAADSSGGSAIAVGTIPLAHRARGRVRLARRGPGARRFRAARPISRRGRIHAVGVAVNARGDTLAAWERSGAIEARTRRASGRLGPVRRLARTPLARAISVALADDGRAVVSWVDAAASEGEAVTRPGIRAAVAGPRGRFGGARLLEAYPDRVLPAGAGALAGFAGTRPLVAWTGRHAVRAAFAQGTAFGAPQDLGALGERAYERAGGLFDLATTPSGAAFAVWIRPFEPDGLSGDVLGAPLAPGAPAFGPAERISTAPEFNGAPSAAFDPSDGSLAVAWRQRGALRQPDGILLSTRPAP